MAEGRPMVLTPYEMTKYIHHLEKANPLSSLVHESCQLVYEQHRGVTQLDMGALIAYHRSKGEHQIAEVLNRVFLIGKGSEAFAFSPSNSPHSELSMALVFWYRRENRQYDVIVARATQTKEIRKKKVACALGGSLAVGCAGTIILAAAGAAHPVGWGLAAATTLASASVGKAAYDYNATMKNVMTGYICKELADKGMITVGLSPDPKSGVDQPWLRMV